MIHAANVRQGPGSIELPRSRTPVVKADALLYAHFERPDLNRARDYLVDFGLIVVSQGEDELFLRGTGSTPYIYHVSRGDAARFIGLGLSVPSADDLKALAKATRRSVEAADGPGGGSVVRLVDPLGVAVSVHYGFAAVAPEPVRAPIPYNAPNQTVRVNDTQRPALAPPQVTKLGHLVLETPDFDRSARWYMDMLGFIPSDVMCLADGTPVGSFMRLDRGDEPTDHHTLFVATGLEFEGRPRRLRGRRPRCGGNGAADPDGEALPPRLGRRPASARQPDLRLLARSLGPEARALCRRGPVRRRPAARLPRARPCGPLSVGPRSAGRLHRRQAYAAAAPQRAQAGGPR